MKSSCIRHIDREPLVLLRKSYIELCSGDRCAAMLLADFEYWHNYKLDLSEEEIARQRDDPTYRADLSLWVYKSTQDLVDDLLGFYRRDTVLKSVKLLEALEFVRTSSDPKNPFNKTRFFLFMPTQVNAALDMLHPGRIKAGQEIHSSRKIDSRQTKNRLSHSRKIDSLPYKETTSESVVCELCGDTGWRIQQKVIRGIAANHRVPCNCTAAAVR